MSGRGRGRWRSRGGGRRQQQGRGRNHHSARPYNAKEDTTTIEEFGMEQQPNATSVSIAIQGCCHGALDAIYDRLQAHEEKSGRKIDLLLCCGDFQSLRNTADFHSFAVPPKYHELGCFYKYYSGEKVAPITTIFIGGNHEASQPLQELYYGGWVAPKIYYLGAAGVVNYRGLRIGGISGIYKQYDFNQSRFERPPYDRSTMRSVYHYRNVESYRLSCLRPGKLDVMLSHDWPQGIEQYGDTQGLIRRKPFFKDEIARNELGSPPLMALLQNLHAKYWFSAHLHVKFHASVAHGPPKKKSTPTVPLIPTQALSSNSTAKAPLGATQFIAPESETCKQGTEDLTDLMTKFLSLDKCLPRRHYLSILHLPSTNEDDTLCYEPEWLAILRKTHELSRARGKQRVRVPNNEEECVITENDLEWVRERFGPECKIPDNFTPNVAVVDPSTQGLPAMPLMGNPQTDQLLQKLELDHLPNLTVPFTGMYNFFRNSTAPAVDCNEIDLDDDEEESEKKIDGVGPVPDTKRAKIDSEEKNGDD